MQAAEFLERLEMPPHLSAFVQSHLDNMRECQNTEFQTESHSRRRTLQGIEHRMENLTRIFTRDGITEKEFLGERNRLMIERQSLEQTSTAVATAQRGIEFFSTVISFANSAKKRFWEGEPETRRRILVSVVSNLEVKDRILRIEAKKPFRIIAERSHYSGRQPQGESNPYFQDENLMS